MQENGLLVSNIPYYSGSRKSLELRLKLVQNLPLACQRETINEYLLRVINIYKDEFLGKLNVNEKFLFIYLSTITASGRILIPKSFYSEAEISKWLKLLSGKRIALNSILFANIPSRNVFRIKKFKTKIKIKRLSQVEVNFCIEKISLNQNKFFSIIHEFATFVNGDFGHILGVPWLELNNIVESVNSSILFKSQ